MLCRIINDAPPHLQAFLALPLGLEAVVVVALIMEAEVIGPSGGGFVRAGFYGQFNVFLDREALFEDAAHASLGRGHFGEGWSGS
mmetsp:Transcript_9025/g.12952  ORF Transcript_9025/g.12952 Transcript_9025/m.12952 type:complete len:85 (-) Transcript_9025:73-327(-)